MYMILGHSQKSRFKISQKFQNSETIRNICLHMCVAASLYVALLCFVVVDMLRVPNVYLSSFLSLIISLIIYVMLFIGFGVRSFKLFIIRFSVCLWLALSFSFSFSC